jgi:invasion protein IalB
VTAWIGCTSAAPGVATGVRRALGAISRDILSAGRGKVGTSFPPALPARRRSARKAARSGDQPVSSRSAPVAQLDRALPSEGRGHRFESCRVRQDFQYRYGNAPAANGRPVTTGIDYSLRDEYRLCDGWSLTAKFDGEVSSPSSIYSGTGVLRKGQKGIVRMRLILVSRLQGATHSAQDLCFGYVDRVTRDLRLRLSLLFMAGAALVWSIGDAAAQQDTSATYQDWVVQCQIQPGPPPQKLCDMVQGTQVKGKNLPFSRLFIERPVKGHPVKLVLQVPVNVSLSANVHLQSSDTDPGFTAPFDRCVPAGCFADFEFKDDTVQKFRAIEGIGKILFKDAGRHDITIPLSFKGFRQAFDALSRE